jgi:hypothetical protein
MTSLSKPQFETGLELPSELPFHFGSENRFRYRSQSRAVGQNPEVQTCAKSCGSRGFVARRPSRPKATEIAPRRGDQQ